MRRLFGMFPRLPGRVPGTTAVQHTSHRAVVARQHLGLVIKFVHEAMHRELLAATGRSRHKNTKKGKRALASGVPAFIRSIVTQRWSHRASDPLVRWPAPVHDAQFWGANPSDCLPIVPPTAEEATLAKQAGAVIISLPPDMQELALTDYTEELAVRAVGASHVRAFFAHCFPSTPSSGTA